MKIVVQRVSSASVTIDGKVHASIDHGMLVLAGISVNDVEEDIIRVADKIVKLRVFSDDNDQMNLSIRETGGAFLVISQFTLLAITKKGNRPSYINAARPEQAIPLYELFLEKLKEFSGLDVLSGIFAADMKVALVNDGPVTIVIDSENWE